jgi:RNA polymerase sigma-70 factor (ECF subfamily)
VSEEHFAAFLLRIRAGDEAAAAELVRQYEPLIRREVRLRLGDPAVARTLDDEDVCQSVLLSFGNEQASTARNKLAKAIRSQHAQKHGGGNVPLDVDEQTPSGDAPTASRIVASRELLELVRQRLDDDERRVADHRAAGHGWAEIAALLGGTPDGRRVQLSRALDRVGPALGLEGSDG